MTSYALALILRDLKLDLRQGLQLLLIPSFFILIATLYPLAIGAEHTTLKTIGGGALMIAALLASILPLATLYRDDALDGTLDLVALSPHPFSVYCLARMTAHWLAAGLPLVLLSPVIAQTFYLDIPASVLLAVLIPATLLFVLIGHVVAALGLGTGNSGLLCLLALPLYAPVLIFGAGALDMAQYAPPENTSTPILLLWAGLCATLPTAPLACAQILLIQRQ